ESSRLIAWQVRRARGASAPTTGQSCRLLGIEGGQHSDGMWHAPEIRPQILDNRSAEDVQPPLSSCSREWGIYVDSAKAEANAQPSGKVDAIPRRDRGWQRKSAALDQRQADRGRRSADRYLDRAAREAGRRRGRERRAAEV